MINGPIDVLIYVLYYIILNRLRYSFCNPLDKESDLSWPNSTIKITTKSINDLSGVRQEEDNQYDFEDDGIGIKYKIKPNAKCTKIEFGNVLIWEYNSEGVSDVDEYPTKITVKPYLSNILVEFPKEFHIYSYRNNKWELTLKTSVESINSGPSEDEIYTVDQIGLGFEISNVKVINVYDKEFSNVIISDVEEFDLIMEGNYFFLYKYKGNKRCIELRYNNMAIWKDPSIRNGRKFPAIIHINTGPKTITFDFTGWYLWLFGEVHNLLSEVEYKLYRRLRIFRLGIEGSISRLKIFTLDINSDDNSIVRENDTDQYTTESNNKPNGFCKYKFKERTRCVKVVYENDIVWSYNENYDLNYPLEIYADISSGRSIKIKFPDRTYVYRYIYNKWTFVALYIDGKLKYDNNPPLLIPNKESFEKKEEKLRG